MWHPSADQKMARQSGLEALISGYDGRHTGGIASARSTSSEKAFGQVTSDGLRVDGYLLVSAK